MFNLKLVEDKSCLKYNLFIKCSIKIENIYFSYVFDKTNKDNATINYCINANINYQIYDGDIPYLTDSEIDSKIIPKFIYPIPSKKK